MKTVLPHRRKQHHNLKSISMPSKKPVEIVVNNQKSRLLCDLKTRVQLHKDWKIKNKQAFWSPAFRSGRWDGYVRYIGEDSGLFQTGLLFQLLEKLGAMGIPYKITDKRETFKDLHAPEGMGELTARVYQEAARLAVVENKVGGIRFQRGILDEATNAGKTLLTGLLIGSFSSKRSAVFLVNSKTLFDQALPDLQELFGKEEVGWVNAKSEDWRRINVCMSQTLGGRLKKDPKYKNRLAKTDILIVDEADELIGRKDCQQILLNAYNATIRLALTGTALKHKDPLRNQLLLSYFGPVLHRITNKELVEQGVSTKPIIRFTTGNKEVRVDDSWDEEYMDGILKNKKRHRRIWKRVDKHIDKDRLPILILFRHHLHAKGLVASMPEHIRDTFTYSVVHGQTSNREAIFQRFNEGKLDILIASMIIKRGKNLPRIKVLINAAGGDSEVVILQIFGRALRSHESKTKVYIEEFWDSGKYLQRHSKHRITYYKKQGFEVKELYKKLTIK
jgi:superfamily II DNA or RNA helicase